MKTRLFMLLLLTLALTASLAMAKEVATVTRFDPGRMPAGVAGTIGEPVGNLNAPYWLLGGWFAGQEAYSVVFNPSAQLTCLTGFQVTTAHMYLDFEAADVPVTFDVFAALGSAVYDETAGCFVPGPVECTGATYTVTIDVAGTYDIAIPLACDCAYIFDPTGAPYLYNLSMNFPTAFTARVVSDNVQATCTTFNDWGEGWEDLEPYFGTYGNVNLWADVNCCSDPVAVEEQTWGSIKSLFR